MYRSILVPLDGSTFAEQAVAPAAAIARRTGARVELVRVVEPPAIQRPSALPGRRRARIDREREYLESQAVALRSTGIETSTRVLSGYATNAILGEADVCRADLVAMTTHGRGPLTRAWSGSVADAVIRTAAVPVLVIRPNADAAPATPEPRRFLVPLDGSSLAEGALSHAVALTCLFGGTLTLVRVTPAAVPPSAYAAAEPLVIPDAGDPLRSLEREAASYLESVRRRLDVPPASLSTVVIRADQAAPALLEHARDAGTDLIVMTTRGLGGLRRLVLGSVADKVLRGGETPVLIVPPAGPEQRPAEAAG